MCACALLSGAGRRSECKAGKEGGVWRMRPYGKRQTGLCSEALDTKKNAEQKKFGNRDLTRQEYESLRHYEKMMRKSECFEASSKEVPPSCRKCMFYQPEWKFRTCTFSSCFYGKDVDVFRRKPLKKDRYSKPRGKKDGRF